METEIFGAEGTMWIRLVEKKVIAEYIKNQLEEDFASDQVSMKEYIDPFTGSKNK